MLKIKRIYEQAKKEDGYRVLVDRLWPRGVSKEKAKLDLWFKDIAPTDALRKWFGHDEARWSEFKRTYKAELRKNKDVVAALKKIIRTEKTVTLLFGAKDEVHNEAVVLLEVLKQ